MFLGLFTFSVFFFFGAHYLEDSGVLEDSDVPNSDVLLSFSFSVFFFFKELLPGVKIKFQDYRRRMDDHKMNESHNVFSPFHFF